MKITNWNDQITYPGEGCIGPDGRSNLYVLAPSRSKNTITAFMEKFCQNFTISIQDDFTIIAWDIGETINFDSETAMLDFLIENHYIGASIYYHNNEPLC